MEYLAFLFSSFLGDPCLLCDQGNERESRKVKAKSNGRQIDVFESPSLVDSDDSDSNEIMNSSGNYSVSNGAIVWYRYRTNREVP
jgi:hypothetical protein